VESSSALIKIVLASIVNIITPLVDYTFTCGRCVTPPARRYDVPRNTSVSIAMSMMAPELFNPGLFNKPGRAAKPLVTTVTQFSPAVTIP
jgi:hypothetical protein